MNGRISRLARALVVAGLAIAPFANTALAQGPTPEGTVITNVAEVNWTDANGNTYSPDSSCASAGTRCFRATSFSTA